MKFTLDNTISAYKSIDLGLDIKGRDLVIAIGNTGCGKSTLIQALLFGADSLKEFTNDRGRKVIESKTERVNFKIGHFIATSETFLPCA